MSNLHFQDCDQTIIFEGSEGMTLVFDGVPGPQGEADKRIGGALLTDPGAGLMVTGTSVAIMRIPSDLNGMALVEVGACCHTAGNSGATGVQIRRVRAGVSVNMLSTQITIDANETDSSTAATPAVINSANRSVQTGDQIHFDITSVSSGSVGVFVSFTFDTV